MCGIYGSTLLYHNEEFKKKLERTEFRGPDQLGITKFDSSIGPITFGHNRLSIIDLDQRSNQPFTYQNKIHLVFNGEIYNFKTLRDQLKNKGYTFNTSSDTEVICAAYLEFGNNCVNHLNGMFAFVIYDVSKQILFGAKDRLGQKPFYYQLSEEGFEFASQLSSIEMFNNGLSISQKAIEKYLTWNSIPHPKSIYNEIKKIEDGHAFVYDLREKQFKTWKYWDIIYPKQNVYKGTLNDAKVELKLLLTDAIQQRMIADVPLGVFLSGGIDSSLIAALASKNTDDKIQTFSVKFNEDGFDESSYAKKVANHLKTRHTTIECDFNEGLDLINNFSHYFDEPFADASAIPSMLLAKYTKPHVTVALSGDGADEAFLGYRRYAKLKKINKAMAVPNVIRKLSIKALSFSNNNRYHAIKPILGAKDVGNAYLHMVTKSNDRWLDISSDATDVDSLKYLMNNQKSYYECAGDFDLKTYLSWDINTKVDRATMAYSLEARSPFLDYRVVEFAQNLPYNYKISNQDQKIILKKILYDYVPKQFFNRPKAGFSMPFEVWFKTNLKDKVLSELSLKNLKDIPNIKPEIVNNMIGEHMKGKWNHSPMIWNLLVLRQWLNNNSSGKSII